MIFDLEAEVGEQPLIARWFDFEREYKRAAAAYLSLEGIAIPESIRKVRQPDKIADVDGDGYEKPKRCRDERWLDDPRHNQADYLNRS